MAPRLLFVVRGVPVPARAGAPIRAHRLATGLAREFEVTMVAPGEPAALPDVEVVCVPPLRVPKRARQLASLAGRRSAEFGQASTRRLRAAVREEARRRAAALVHYDDVTAGLAGPVAGAVNAFAPHNVEHRILEETRAHARGARRWFAGVDGAKLRREEQRLWRAMDLCVAVSEHDAEAMRRGGARRVVVAPNGTDPVERLPPPARGGPLRLLFVGAGSYQPNRAGLLWLMDEVLPLLGDLPWALDVVGAEPGSLPARPGVTVHGKVPSVDPYYEAAHVAVVPILYGSGTRLKVVEAMARGRPVVSTGVGAEGLPVQAGLHYLRGDDAPGFAVALREAGARDLEPMLARARAAAEELFWPRIAADLAAVYREALG